MPAGLEVRLTLPLPEVMERLRQPLLSGGVTLRPRNPPEAATDAVELAGRARAAVYVDCGSARIALPGGGSRELSLARDFRQYRQRVKGRDYAVWRTLQLDVVARIEAFPRADGVAGTRLRVTPRFYLARERLVAGGVRPMVFRDQSEFASGEAAAFPNVPQPCRSNGRLEEELRLALLRLDVPAGTAAAARPAARGPR